MTIREIKTVDFDGILREFTGKPGEPHYTIHEQRSWGCGNYTNWNVYFHVPHSPGAPFGAGYYLGRGFTQAEAQQIRDAHIAQKQETI